MVVHLVLVAVDWGSAPCSCGGRLWPPQDWCSTMAWQKEREVEVEVEVGWKYLSDPDFMTLIASTC